MRKLAVLFVGLLILSGCTFLSPREGGLITTSPPGANVYIIKSQTNKRELMGVTPCSYWIKRERRDMFIVFEKNGYEPERIPLPSRGSNMNISINLRKVTDG
jgi:hypothetical protein